MSEKGFGDHINRSVVKNPLLSTAVVGLSIEDLTHNAVLLPAVPSQELITRQDKQCGSQTPLTNTNLSSNFPSGDANSNTIQTNLDKQNSRDDFKENEFDTQSKTTIKSDDDFDVNEYFARLHGTRYVSAPLNRKEDQNANLPVEENLEEINLNEPEKEQSITADIAQNFSQLPAVLPQVASAVFSSISNMWNLKKEDYRPEQMTGYNQDVSIGFNGNNEVNTSITGYKEAPEVSKSVAPPPLKEPPISGTSNYRIATKKKVYAQMPGLTGDAYNIPASQLFTDNTQTKSDINTIHTDNTQTSHYFKPEVNMQPKIDSNTASELPSVVEETKTMSKPSQNPVYNFFTPIQNVETDIKPIETFQANTAAPIIPPPPMFSNRRDSQGSVGKTVLPPSVARRIAANQPLIKPQVPTMITHENIFVPPFTEPCLSKTNAPMFNSSTFTSDVNPILAVTQGIPVTETISAVDQANISSAFTTISPPVTEFFPTEKTVSVKTEIQTEKLQEQSQVNTPSVHNITSQIFTPLSPNQESQNVMKSMQKPSLPAEKFDVTNPPPLFFDPNSMYQPTEYTDPIKPIFQNTTSSEPTTTVLEPPKVASKVNYRMTKKRPQYYAGPIEGVGSISNNVIPTLNPVQTQYDSFQGSLFTPIQEPQMSQNVSTAFIATTDNASTLSTQAPMFGIPPVQSTYQQDYNTVFDLSRPTTENYDQPQIEEKGFGLLGSLKSKLSSIDINKIQNTVTTFFDPAYNEAKDQQNVAAIPSSSEDNSTFDIFVGSSNKIQPALTSNYSSDYNLSFQQNANVPGSYNDNKEQQTAHYSMWPATNSVFQNNYSSQNNTKVDESQTNTTSGKYISTIDTPFALPSLPISIIENPNSCQESVFTIDISKTCNLIPQVTTVNNPLSLFSMPHIDTETTSLDDNIIESVTNLVLAPSPQPFDNSAEESKETISESCPPPTQNTFEPFDTFTINDDKEPDSNADKVVKSSEEEINSSSKITGYKQEPLENETFLKFFEHTPKTSHLFDFPSLSALDTSEENEVTAIESKISNIALQESEKTTILEENLTENVSELSICETCREVNKHEERGEVEDLTTQLIENITAPIQLLNPVGVSLPISEHIPDIALEETVSDPLDDIAQVTEEFIENIPIHSVTELLEDANLDGTVSNYGWKVTDMNDILNSPLIDHNYLQDVSSIGFLQNEIVENIPMNASDEIKAGYKNSHDEIVLPPLPILPTAPPDEDSKSDESGLDVHSIEQDAKKDFPIYEEFVIEPSETDDDKIEFMVRENSTDEPLPAVDTFTNRVERFKQMGTDTDESQVTMATIPVSTSPPLTMASYFDTGNYAVDAYYKKSMKPQPRIADNVPTRVPPGFEKEFSKRFPCVTSTGFLREHITRIPDTATQTHVSPSLTYTQKGTTNIPTDAKSASAIETILTKPLDEQIIAADTERLPAFSSLTEQPKETKTIVEPKPKLLPDPKNFFASDPEPIKETDEHNSFNRLSSYFTTPPKADNAKSFFELSQSQDHYRHALKNASEAHKTDESRYNNNMKLIHDLATYRDITPNEIVRTVNYFTVEYKNSNESIGEGVLNNKEINMPIEDVVKKCKNCCNFNVGCIKNLELEYSNLKIKKYMDSEDKKGNANMDKGNEARANSVTVNFMEHSMKEDDGVAILTENRNTSEYVPVKYHWFYRVDKDGQSTWRGFSVADSSSLENAFNSPDLNENTLVPTDGGRYDVNIVGRIRIPVYWSENPTKVQRCSWFYCNTDGRYVPYEEDVAERLEVEYQHGVSTGEWHRRLVLPNNELVVMHGSGVMVHFLQNSVDSFSGSPQSMTRPRVVKRGSIESEIEDTEPSSIDHLLLLCHGVGSACDMRMRPVEAVVDDFRKTSMQLLQSHYKNSYDSGLVGRIEVLPISWHSSLHSGETGVDRRLANVTLDSMPWLRNFTNDTVLDVLFYTSPVFGQTIIDTVCKEMNRIYNLFKKRNPDFKGGVSLGGHSLGSVILYDLLGHQTPESTDSKYSMEKKYVHENAGTGQPMLKYPKLEFCPEALFALGSPIAIFECVRGVEMLGKEFCLPTCGKFFNIFHPYDPIAYRIEPMINPELRQIKPSLIPHHKGRKRMHLELKETMTRLGADIKQKLIESIKSTWFSMWNTAPPTTDQLEKVVEEEMEKEELNDECKQDNLQDKEATPEMLGRLNGGRRIDYVLQEAPFEMINEYLFAMNSHVCYWVSADTILLILREVYASMRVQPDCCVPQNNLTVERTRLVTNDGVVITSLESPSTSRGSPR